MNVLDAILNLILSFVMSQTLGLCENIKERLAQQSSMKMN